MSSKVVGSRYGMLIVLSIESTGATPKVLCRCDCGTEVIKQINHLYSGATKSCGCLRKGRPKKHGMRQYVEYGVWQNMKNRCLNSNASGFNRYGGRGITVCDRWINSFENFLSDMGLRPSVNHSIERIDNNGNYEPGNCKWATNSDQLANKRTTKLSAEKAQEIRVLRKSGVTYKALSEKFGVSEGSIAFVLANKQWVDSSYQPESSNKLKVVD